MDKILKINYLILELTKINGYIHLESIDVIDNKHLFAIEEITEDLAEILELRIFGYDWEYSDIFEREVLPEVNNHAFMREYSAYLGNLAHYFHSVGNLQLTKDLIDSPQDCLNYIYSLAKYYRLFYSE